MRSVPLCSVLSALVVVAVHPASGQRPTHLQVSLAVAGINGDTTLEVRTIQLNEPACHGAEATYSFRNGQLVSIRESYGMSWGVSGTEYYFRFDTLMLIKDHEDHFAWLADTTTQDRTRLHRVFERTYYMWGITDCFHVERSGQAVFIEDACGHMEFDDRLVTLIQLVPPTTDASR